MQELAHVDKTCSVITEQLYILCASQFQTNTTGIHVRKSVIKPKNVRKISNIYISKRKKSNIKIHVEHTEITSNISSLFFSL